MGLNIYLFGAGSVIYRVLDSAGIYQANALPTLKEASVKFDGKLETQFGSAAYPEDAASGERKITGTLKWGAMDASQLNDIIFGGVRTAGTIKVVQNEGGTAGVAPVANNYTAAVGATPWVDLGVVSAVSGKQMRRVTTVTANGQYSFAASTGTWTYFFPTSIKCPSNVHQDSGVSPLAGGDTRRTKRRAASGSTSVNPTNGLRSTPSSGTSWSGLSNNAARFMRSRISRRSKKPPAST